MPNDFALMGSALYGRLGTVQYTYATQGTATTTGSVGVYNGMAPQETLTPYVIFQRMSGLDEYTFDTRGESLEYMVKAVSDRAYPGMQAYPIYGQAHDALQDAPLNVGSYVLMRCRRRSQFEYRDTDGYLHVGGLYRIDIEIE